MNDKYKMPPPALKDKKAIMDAEKTGFVNKVDYTRPVGVSPIEADLGLLGPYPSVISGDHIGATGQDANGIWTQQYSAGGSILDSLLDAPTMPPKPQKPKAPNPIDPQKIQQARAKKSQDSAQGFFSKQPALSGFAIGVAAMYLLNKYL